MQVLAKQVVQQHVVVGVVKDVRLHAVGLAKMGVVKDVLVFVSTPVNRCAWAHAKKPVVLDAKRDALWGVVQAADAHVKGIVLEIVRGHVLAVVGLDVLAAAVIIN